MVQAVAEFQKMSIHERLQLVEDLWDSIALEGDALDVPEWQKDVLDSRAKAFDLNPESGIPWETAKEIIRGHHA